MLYKLSDVYLSLLTHINAFVIRITFMILDGLKMTTII